MCFKALISNTDERGVPLPPLRADPAYLEAFATIDSFALLHEDAYDDTRPIAPEGVDPAVLDVRLLTPLDLAVSKLARFNDMDQGDIRALARSSPIESHALRRRAEDALSDYVGSLPRIRTSIDIATRIVMKETAGKPAKKGASR